MTSKTRRSRSRWKMCRQSWRQGGDRCWLHCPIRHPWRDMTKHWFLCIRQAVTRTSITAVPSSVFLCTLAFFLRWNFTPPPPRRDIHYQVPSWGGQRYELGFFFFSRLERRRFCEIVLEILKHRSWHNSVRVYTQVETFSEPDSILMIYPRNLQVPFSATILT